MSSKKPFPDPALMPPLMNEADIGSGEKTPADRETEDLIRQIPPLPGPGGERADGESESTGSCGFDAGAARQRMEQEASLLRDEPSEQLDNLDPVPPKGA